MSLKYQSKVKDKEELVKESTTVKESVEILEAPLPDPSPSIKPIDEGVDQGDKEHLKRVQNLLDPPMLAPSVLMPSQKAPSAADLAFQEKKRKVEIINSYAWTAVQIAVALCILALGVSYLRAVSIAPLKALNS
ncbi:MAG: hypothetical protein ACRBFS_21615 [Aureispira sp.]